MEPALVQSTFSLPPEIQAGLTSDDLVRFGGVVRDRSGAIVMHLDEVRLFDADTEGFKRLATTVRKSRLFVPFLLVAAGAAGRSAYAVARRRRLSSIPESLDNYNGSLRVYLEAVEEGRLDTGAIDRLVSDLAVVASAGDRNSISVDFSTEDATILIRVIVDYTEQLAADNNVDLSEFRAERLTAKNDSGAALARHLAAQRRVLRHAG